MSRPPRTHRASRVGRTTPAPKAERTVIYCRISLDAAGEGLGVQRQESECRALCERHGWEVAEVYTDNDISATSAKVRRPEFERLLSDPPTRIVVWHTDRLFRRLSDMERVTDLGILVSAVQAGEIDLSTPAGLMMVEQLTVFARFEQRLKSQRQQAAHRQRVESGRPWWGHRRPFGYTAEAQLHETEGPALRHCFRLIREGSTYADAARWLNSEGFTTTTGKRQWNGSNLSRLMRDPRNAGLIHYKYEVQGRGDWDPIVPEEEWRAILDRSEVIASGKAPAPEGKRVRSLLGGIARCECGEPMKRTRQHSKRKDGQTVHTYIYQCPMHCTSINAEWLDGFVAMVWLGSAGSAFEPFGAVPEVADSEAQAAAAEAVTLRDRLDELATMYAQGKVTGDQLARGSAPLREQLDKAEQRAMSFYSASPLDRLYSQVELLKAWQSEELTLDQRREAVTKHVRSITVRKRHHRNERANPSMVSLIMRATNEPPPLPEMSDDA